MSDISKELDTDVHLLPVNGHQSARVTFSIKGWLMIAALAIGGPGSTWAVMRVEINALKEQTAALSVQTAAIKQQGSEERERMVKLETIVQNQQNQIQTQAGQYGEFIGVVKSMVRIEQTVDDI
jgi:FtsZ-binding cell division protein ZapB